MEKRKKEEREKEEEEEEDFLSYQSIIFSRYLDDKLIYQYSQKYHRDRIMAFDQIFIGTFLPHVGQLFIKIVLDSIEEGRKKRKFEISLEEIVVDARREDKIKNLPSHHRSFNPTSKMRRKCLPRIEIIY